MDRTETDERSPWKLALLGALFVLLAFLPTLRNGPVWDDHHLVVGNPYFQSLVGILDLFRHDIWTTTGLGVRSEYYRPLPMLSFAADHALGNGSAAVFHLGNALLHALAAFVLALAISRAVRGSSRFIPIACALAWGLSPVGTEAVAWISGRFDLLATLFTLLALLANFGQGWKAVALTVSAIAASLLCKEAAILGPVLLAASDLLLLGRRPRTIALKYMALGLVVAGKITLRSWVGVITAQATPEAWELVRSYAFMVASVLRRVVWPSDLDAFHPYVAPSIATTCVVGGATALFSLFLAWGSFRGRDPSRFRVAFFGWAWFCIMLAPSALTGPALDMVGDRYAYLPNLGLAFLGAAVLLEVRDRLLEKWPAAKLTRLGASLAVIVLGASTFVSVRRLRDWRDDHALHQASLRAHPGNPYALYALGEQAVLAGDYQGGDALLRRAIETGPRPWRALNALCYSLLNQHRLEEGEAQCAASLAIHGHDPRTWINLASIRAKQGRWKEALEYARRGRQYRARYAESHYLAAVALANLGKLSEAATELGDALGNDPQHGPARKLARQFEESGIATF